MFNWVEVYFGMDFNEYSRIRNLLEDNGIPAKVRIHNIRTRMSNEQMTSSAMGGSSAALTSAGSKSLNDEYKILVKKDDLENARFLISSKKL